MKPTLSLISEVRAVNHLTQGLSSRFFGRFRFRRSFRQPDFFRIVQDYVHKFIESLYKKFESVWCSLRGISTQSHRIVPSNTVAWGDKDGDYVKIRLKFKLTIILPSSLKSRLSYNQICILCPDWRYLKITFCKSQASDYFALSRTLS